MLGYINDKGLLIHRESVQLGESSGCFIHINVYLHPSFVQGVAPRVERGWLCAAG